MSLSPYMLYIKIAGGVLAAAGIFWFGWHQGALGPKRDLATLQAQDWQAKFTASQVALGAVQGQLAHEQKTAANNSTVIQGLTDANAKTAADRDHYAAMYQRLFDRPASPATGSLAVPAAPSGQGAPGSGGADSGSEAAGLLADARAECIRNDDRLDALSAEITPQLKGAP